MGIAARAFGHPASLLPALMLVAALVGAFELSSRLMNYVQQEFGTEAFERLENWQRLQARRQCPG